MMISYTRRNYHLLSLVPCSSMLFEERINNNRREHTIKEIFSLQLLAVVVVVVMMIAYRNCYYTHWHEYTSSRNFRLEQSPNDVKNVNRFALKWALTNYNRSIITTIVFDCTKGVRSYTRGMNVICTRIISNYLHTRIQLNVLSYLHGRYLKLYEKIYNPRYEIYMQVQ